jgi:hypothetical protein
MSFVLRRLTLSDDDDGVDQRAAKRQRARQQRNDLSGEEVFSFKKKERDKTVDFYRMIS